ncbi:Adenosylmethionine-8-amino-7-oxononanoate aminotransferase [Leucobacter sp. 7(1)]|uniref:aminotransferase family protein n=1 Tax=Leucobacter sp. 7(1) TaxID=1255613 RepID=UPI00097E7DDE|nr:aspartate aminotransferase family protein [Leucobacter sp. 7(1)]SJN08477.1 Adenosylmethionine-8-amino-7-oxononanoate aminotransferase [Leucobacter sp. 7(1)]
MSHLFYQAKGRRPVGTRAEGITIWDETGRPVIDGASGAMVVNIGHSNERVLAAMRDQLDRATFLYRLQFENEPAEQFAAALAQRMPADLDKVFFVSGGSEAVESAIKLARQWAVATAQPERWKVISRFPSYHGSTLGALAVTGYDLLTQHYLPMMQPMPKIPAPTAYLDRDTLTMAERGLRYADMLETQILAEGPESVLAFIMEPVGGATTGALVAPDSYYARVREICDRYGILLIHDEVMSGAGRTGTYLAGDHWGCRPDIVALSKGLGAGYTPLGAMIAPDRIVEPVLAGGGFAHGHTYAGNPLASAAGLAVLGEIDRLDLLSNTTLMGERLLAGLRELAERHPVIGDVRGKGLLLAAEFVADRDTMEPLPAELNAHERMVELAFERGLILYSRRTRGGKSGDHFLVCPPMIVTAEQVDQILSILDDTLVALERELGLPTS